ncbi:MAG: VOC family protein [Cyclobacteriaceae bacterium]
MSGLRSCIYRVPDLPAAREWYGKVFETQPYFDEEYYVGFDIGGYELGLLPGSTTEINLSGLSYWAVDNIEKVIDKFISDGSTLIEDVQDVGDGVKLAAVSDLWNNAIGLIENRFFRIGERNHHPVAAVVPGVTALGGVFFKTKTPEKLKSWYRENLGIRAGEYGGQWHWRKEAAGNGPGFTVWSVFDSDTSYFAPSVHDVMINYRVNDLEALLTHLEKKGIKQVGEMESFPYGKFAWILDPDGRKIELWQPVDDEYSNLDGETMGAE